MIDRSKNLQRRHRFWGDLWPGDILEGLHADVMIGPDGRIGLAMPPRDSYADA